MLFFLKFHLITSTSKIYTVHAVYDCVNTNIFHLLFSFYRKLDCFTLFSIYPNSVSVDFFWFELPIRIFHKHSLDLKISCIFLVALEIGSSPMREQCMFVKNTNFGYVEWYKFVGRREKGIRAKGGETGETT